MGYEIPWNCGTCKASFGSQAELRAHRADAHPELEAGAVAHAQVMANGGDEYEAIEASDKAIKEYREAVR